ncbi:hypothetical protein B0T26DRAFT_364218 [Lasiosphaeria miniovina]|uniref:C2H2-type domain-containing protein n=1 Tax=Lasiosphaeria miniovina TaxID=1954250 RepID=A0AA40DS06_9PEZI|nr:uncharacterized protein B0T26DRAFT_364218 [Lasiosphaeria miniovina]KAK0713405.1 hypothetical protein B0T26DRAFT_364218 [Lasiosphaeria miniovina]
MVGARKTNKRGGSKDIDDQRPRKRQGGDQGRANHEPPFACHFAKQDPTGHDSCLKFGFTRTPDIWQHFRRKHPSVPTRCVKCGLLFSGDEKVREWQEHARQRACLKQEIPFVGGITPGQWDDIQDDQEAPGPGTPMERRWYRIWEILFPELPRPPSPYAGSGFRERMGHVFQSFIQAGEVQKLVEASGFAPQQHRQLMDFSASLLGSVLAFALQRDVEKAGTVGAGVESARKPSAPIRPPPLITDGIGPLIANPGLGLPQQQEMLPFAPFDKISPPFSQIHPLFDQQQHIANHSSGFNLFPALVDGVVDEGHNYLIDGSQRGWA